jgi:hypothetical protein
LKATHLTIILRPIAKSWDAVNDTGHMVSVSGDTESIVSHAAETGHGTGTGTSSFD